MRMINLISKNVGKKVFNRHQIGTSKRCETLEGYSSYERMWVADNLPHCKKRARMQYSLEWIQNKLLVLERGILGETKKKTLRGGRYFLKNKDSKMHLGWCKIDESRQLLSGQF
jgi:hypothetical protein